MLETTLMAIVVTIVVMIAKPFVPISVRTTVKKFFNACALRVRIKEGAPPSTF